MPGFLVGGPQMALGYFREFGNALAYWNFITLGEGADQLRDLGIDPEDIQMYELKFVEDRHPELLEAVFKSNSITHERRVNELQEHLDEVPDGLGKESRNNSSILAEATPDTGSSSSSDSGRAVRDVENEIEHDS